MIALLAAIAFLAQQEGHATPSSGVLRPVAPPPTEMPGVVPVPEFPEPPERDEIVVGDFTLEYRCCADCEITYVDACEPGDAGDEDISPPEIEKSPFGPSPTPD